MEKISFFLKEGEEISSFQNSKKIAIYEKQNKWIKKEEIKINVGQFNTMQSLRKYFVYIVNKLDDCKIVVVDKAQGIPYGVFYEADYSIWELSGEPEEFLNMIIEGEKKHDVETKNSENESVAKKIEDGYFLIDLNELQFTKPELTSKKAIIPFLEKEAFDVLEVICCHIPPWLIEKEKKNEITMDVSKLKKNEYKLLISRGKEEQ